MRKSLLFGLLFLVASCSVQKEKDFEGQGGRRYHAVVEEPDGEETRVYADSRLRVHWNEEDHISIFERTTYNQEYEFLGDTGDTSGDFDPIANSGYHTGGDIEDGHVYAIYPYDKKNKCDYDGKITVTFPSVQHYKQNSFGIGANIMVAKTNTTDLRFKHVGGYRTLRLYGAGVTVSSVKLESNGPEFLSGRTDVTIGSDGKPSVAFIESATNSKSVELVCDTPVTLGSTASDYVEFWFVLPPGVLTEGFTITITDSNGNTFTKSTSNAITIQSGVKKNMSAFEVTIEGSGQMAIPEAVDLGLPSGIKWASFNLGASRPEEYGDYYAWGETEPYYISQDPLTWKEGKEAGYAWSSYKWFMGSERTMTKYCSDSYYGYNGFTDNKTVLDSEDDAAHVNLGGNWRMPTDDEFTELLQSCTWEWTTQNGVNGYLVTGSNGNSIFFPAAGGREDQILASGVLDILGGTYWSSSSPGHSESWFLYFNSDRLMIDTDLNRFDGLSIRPVYGEFISVGSVSLNKTSLSLLEGSTEQLSVTISPTNATEKKVTWASSNPSVASVDLRNGVVSAVSAGTAIITAWASDGEHSASCSVTVIERETVSVPGAVDLGLPSGLLWASSNLGATTPEEYGDYYAWGETEPKTDYSLETYKWCMGSSDTMTKYCTDSSYGYNGFTDNKTVLDSEDDAAHVNLGGNWRMPTYDEWTELRIGCTWEWTTQNGVNGYLVIGSNGNSIFLPAAGYKYDTNLDNVGSNGYYWSSSLTSDNPYYARFVYFDFGYVSRSISHRTDGGSVRPVYSTPIPVESVSLNVNQFSLPVGATTSLVATVLPSNATNSSVSWSSSDVSIAEVSSSGVVRGVAPGSAVITVITADGGKTATCTVIVTETETVPYAVTTPEAIDLGLSVKWASFNLGATSPEEFGDYFAWGETEPYYISQDPLIWKDGKEAGYDWSSYRWCMGSYTTMTKYCQNADYGYNGFIDDKTVLDPVNDAAHVNLGGNWRMPTYAELTELRNNCTWTWTTQNGVNGDLVTGPNGNSIFLPAAGGRGLTGLVTGSYGYYWSSSITTGNPPDAWVVFFGSGDVGRDSNGRCGGRSVRPVCD